MYSDGFQDQFGGPKGRKFMAKKFKKLLGKIVTTIKKNNPGRL